MYTADPIGLIYHVWIAMYDTEQVNVVSKELHILSYYYIQGVPKVGPQTEMPNRYSGSFPT